MVVSSFFVKADVCGFRARPPPSCDINVGESTQQQKNLFSRKYLKKRIVFFSERARDFVCKFNEKKKNEIVAVRGKERVVAFFEEEISFFFVLFLSL